MEQRNPRRARSCSSIKQNPSQNRKIRSWMLRYRPGNVLLSRFLTKLRPLLSVRRRSPLQNQEHRTSVKNLILVDLVFEKTCQAMQPYRVLPSPRINRRPLRAKQAVRRSVACLLALYSLSLNPSCVALNPSDS